MATITAAGAKHLSNQNYTSGSATLADTILAYVSSEGPRQVAEENIEDIFFEFPKVSETVTKLTDKGWLR